MSEDIEQCPFCGGEGIELRGMDDPLENKWVYCLSCGSEGPQNRDKTDAILLWNAAYNQLEAKDDEIARLSEHVSNLSSALDEANEMCHSYSMNLKIEQHRVAAGDKRQDKLEAEIEKLKQWHEDIAQQLSKVTTERDIAIHLLENKQCLINQLTEHKEIWCKRAFESLNQRDEARRVARRLYQLTRNEPQSSRVDETESDA